MPKISVVIPCFNGAEFLSRSINCVLSQTFQDWELIFIDDGSTDNSLDIARTYNDQRIKIIHQDNNGVSYARNEGLKIAQGKYVAFLDSDDEWNNGFMEKMLSALESNPDAVLAYCGWKNVGLAGKRSNPFIPPSYETSDKISILFTSCRWPIHAALVRMEAVQVGGCFDNRYKNAEDYALWLRIAINGKIMLVPEVLASYHFHEGGQASNNKASAALQFWRAQLEFLSQNPTIRRKLGKHANKLVDGELLRKGYECYWQRQLEEARAIFHIVMRQGYGNMKDWLYMLPSILPLQLYKLLVNTIDKVEK